MNLEGRQRVLKHAETKMKETLTRIRRLNTALRKWERMAERQKRAIAELEKEALQVRIRQLEKQVGSGHRDVNFDEGGEE